MYKDEYGNVWASYEDYQTYLKEISEEDNDNQQVVNELIGNFLSNSMNTKNDKSIESGQKNE